MGKCEICTYNIGVVCQASSKDSKLNGCDPFDDLKFECRLCIYNYKFEGKHQCKSQCKDFGLRVK